MSAGDRRRDRSRRDERPGRSSGASAPGELCLDEVHRFPNDPVELPDGLHWDVLGLYREVLEGLRGQVASAPGVASIGIDSWGVDFGLLDDAGALLGNPYPLPRCAERPAASSACTARVPPSACTAARESSTCRSTRCSSSRPHREDPRSRPHARCC